MSLMRAKVEAAISYKDLGQLDHIIRSCSLK